MTEQTIAPWSHEGFKEDVVRDRVFRRRMRVAEMLADGYDPRTISKAEEIRLTSVYDDIRWLREKNYIDATLRSKKRFHPTDETNFMIADLLRKNKSYNEIGEALGVSPSTVGNYLKKTRDAGIVAALKHKRGIREEKKNEGISISKRTELRFMEMFNCTPEEKSKANMSLFYADEIATVEREGKKGIKKIQSSVMKVLNKYHLIPTILEMNKLERNRGATSS